MVLHDCYSPRRGCLVDLEETKSGVIDRLFLHHPCRNGSDSETIYRTAFPASAVMVVEAMERPEEPDSNQCGDVRSGWCVRLGSVEMARVVGCSWNEC